VGGSPKGDPRPHFATGTGKKGVRGSEEARGENDSFGGAKEAPAGWYVSKKGFLRVLPERIAGVSETGAEPALRVHRGAWSFKVTRPPVFVPWASRWKPKEDRPVVHAKLGPILYVEVRGEPGKVTVFPPEQFVADQDKVAGAAESRRLLAVAMVSAFAMTYRMAFDARGGRQSSPVEYGLELPGLDVFGVPGRDIVWADMSPGPGRVEVETQDPMIAARLLAWALAGAVEPLSDVVSGVR